MTTSGLSAVSGLSSLFGGGGLPPSAFTSDLVFWMFARSNVRVGGARDFDGVNQTFSLADFAAVDLGTDDFTISLMFNRDATGNEVLMAKYQDASNYWKVEFTAGNLLHFIAVVAGVTKYEITGTTAITAAGWHSAVFVGDRDSTPLTQVFLDGVDDTAASPTVTTTDLDNSGSFYIGESGASSLYFNGQACRFGVANSSTVSSDEIAELYNKGAGQIYTRLSSALQTKFTQYCNGCDPSGNLIAAVGSDLTANNNPGSPEGPEVEVISDFTSGNTHGTMSGSGSEIWTPDTKTGSSGLGLKFDGDNDLIELGSVTPGHPLMLNGSAGTVTAWFLQESGGDISQRIIDKSDNVSGENGWVIHSGQSGGGFSGNERAFTFSVNNTSFYHMTTNTAYSYNTHTHLAVTWDATGEPVFYIDGAVVASALSFGSKAAIPNANTNARIASWNHSTGREWKGVLDDIRVYNTQLNAAEVAYVKESFTGVTNVTSVDPGNTNLVAYWKIDDGPAPNGGDQDTVIKWIGKGPSKTDFQESTRSARPLLRTGANGINNKSVVEFNGTSSIIIHTGIPITSEDGQVSVVFKTGTSAFSADQVLLSSADEGVANEYLMMGINGSGRLFIEFNDAGTVHRVDGTITLSTNTEYYACFKSSGIAWSMEIDGVSEFVTVTGSNSGKWFGDLAGADSTVIGARKISTGEDSWFEGSIAEISAFSNVLGSFNQDELNRYFADEYQIEWMGGAEAPVAGFQSTWKTDNAGSSNTDQISLPLVSSGTYNCTVDWGDGNEDTITVWNQANTTHTYAASGTYTVTISGTLTGWSFNNGADKLKILTIENWGVLNPGNNGSHFHGCSNLVVNSSDAPQLSGVSNLGSMFKNCACTVVIGGNWPVTSAVTTITAMFSGCTLFNQDLNGWNTSGAGNFNNLFSNCAAFNGNIESWNTDANIDFGSVFEGCSAFNRSLNTWNVSGISSFAAGFKNATAFNGDITGWDVSSATSFASLFDGATSFNQDISGWNTTGVTNFNSMFKGATSFNQNINNWDLSAATSIGSIFENASAFNQDLNSWVVTNCTDTAMAFKNASAFNGNIISWNVSGWTTFASLFHGATVFNVNISGWDTGSATTFNNMFRDAAAFDQTVGDWDVADVTDMSSFLEGGGLSTANYSNLLIDWEAQAVQNNVSFHAGSSTYNTAANAARAALIADHSWTITDGGAA